MTTKGFADLDALPRPQLLAVAYDYMLTGMIQGRALTPMLTLQGNIPEVETLPIDQWMGASPVYTGRMRRLMHIAGDDVAAIMKALQLDVGFVHGYMDVAYKIDDSQHGEFWLLHCGALLDVEPFGEQQVFNMCHTIEDPTFDATALATNPKARIRPIHRPPRSPADRHPHCHWTLAIDEANEPVGPIAHTDRVGRLALAKVPNEIGSARDGRLHDYRGNFEPAFRLTDLTSGAAAAVAREFQIQSHLLMASQHLAVADRTSEETSRRMTDEGWRTFGWILAARLARTLNLQADVEGVADALALTPAIPPGFQRSVTRNEDRIGIVLEPIYDGILDADHPGWVGSLARGVSTGIEGTVGGIGLESTAVDVVVDKSHVRLALTVAPAAADRPMPDMVQLGYIGKASTWSFDSLLQ